MHISITAVVLVFDGYDSNGVHVKHTAVWTAITWIYHISIISIWLYLYSTILYTGLILFYYNVKEIHLKRHAASYLCRYMCVCSCSTGTEEVVVEVSLVIETDADRPRILSEKQLLFSVYKILCGHFVECLYGQCGGNNCKME